MLKENIRRLKGNIQRGFQGDSRFFQPLRAEEWPPGRPLPGRLWSKVVCKAFAFYKSNYTNEL